MLSMRITGGKYLNRKVIIPEGDLEIRPAMDRMRESLFSILGNLGGMSFCDLFSGSGCIGLEAASRGASLVHLVELDGKKKSMIEKNCLFVGEDCSLRLYIENVFDFLELSKTVYDIVYADPPFPMENKLEILKTSLQYGRVKNEGLFIIHIPATEKDCWEKKYGTYFLTDSRTYGRNTFLFYRNIPE